MLKLSELYVLEQKRVDSIIGTRLKDALETELDGENVVRSLDSRGIGQLRDKLKSRKGEILSLFEGDFVRKQAVIEQIGTRRKKHSTDKLARIANEMIKRRVDVTLDEFIKDKNNGVLEASIGMGRKGFLDEVLDGNIPIPDIEQETQAPEEHDDR